MYPTIINPFFFHLSLPPIHPPYIHPFLLTSLPSHASSFSHPLSFHPQTPSAFSFLFSSSCFTPFSTSASSSDVYGSLMEASIKYDISQKQLRQRVYFQPQDGCVDVWMGGWMEGCVQDNPAGHYHSRSHVSVQLFFCSSILSSC